MSAVWPGNPYPRGATWDGAGVNFSLFSENATRVELCLFDATGAHEVQRIALNEHTDQIWHCYLPEARPGLLYGYRCHGPYDPQRGQRFNANKLLIEPYARALSGPLLWSDAHFGYDVQDPALDLSFDARDSAPGTPKCRVIDTAFNWEDDRPPRTDWHDTVIYEAHVRGMTQHHPQVPPALRGTYAGFATAPIIEHFKRLGVTAVELMPVHAFVDDRRLVKQGLRNYWGYNTIGYLAPELRYAAGDPVEEFKSMVKRLHAAGIEVILDVVYNHTAESDELGPTLSFRGIDNAAYYRLRPDEPRRYMDFTGTGNTLNLQHPRVLQLLMDSLRYWVQEMHVDGFRFDLASALARELFAVDRLGSFFDTIAQDPVLSQVKLIAEPWDVGAGGYQVGNFPAGWNEWNDKYRDSMRAYWKGDGGLLGEFAQRFTGSADLYEASGRKPHASINFVTAHDGFTLADLVAYDHKHNAANGEDNRDGSDDNRSWNCGIEGPSEDVAIKTLRARQKRNLIATLLLSQGVPMLLSGDELGRSQDGNNNGYCQDNALSWINWQLDPDQHEFLAFVERVIALRRSHAIFSRRYFLSGKPVAGESFKDVTWFTPAGTEMTDFDWQQGFARCLAVHLSGAAVHRTDRRGQPVRDENFTVLFNAHHDAMEFVLPPLNAARCWRVELTSETGRPGPAEHLAGGAKRAVLARSLLLLMEVSAQR